MIDLYVFCVTALAVARLCVLMTEDRITEPFRAAIKRRFGPEHMITFGIVCPWCWSVWFAFPMVTITYLTQHPLWMGALSALAISYIASRLADR